jgi:hypothetical protein
MYRSSPCYLYNLAGTHHLSPSIANCNPLGYYRLLSQILFVNWGSGTSYLLLRAPGTSSCFGTAPLHTSSMCVDQHRSSSTRTTPFSRKFPFSTPFFSGPWNPAACLLWPVPFLSMPACRSSPNFCCRREQLILQRAPNWFLIWARASLPPPRLRARRARRPPPRLRARRAWRLGAECDRAEEGSLSRRLAGRCGGDWLRVQERAVQQTSGGAGRLGGVGRGKRRCWPRLGR